MVELKQVGVTFTSTKINSIITNYVKSIVSPSIQAHMKK